MNTTFLSAQRLSQRLGLPLQWVESEARENRIPHLMAGRRRYFDPDIAEQAIRKRLATGSDGVSNDSIEAVRP